MGATAGCTTKVATIANGASLSDEIDLEGFSLAAIEMPTGWTAASLTFQGCSVSGGIFREIHEDGGTAVAATVAASRIVLLNTNATNNLRALRFIKIRSGTSGTPVNQGAERILTLILKA